MLDDGVVAEVRPEAEGEDLLRAATAAPRAAPEEPAMEPPGEDGDEADQEEDAPEAQPDDEGAEPEPPPEGRVPDWVIQRFEDSITRRGEREESGPGPEGDEAA